MIKVRTCINCRKKKSKEQLLRFVSYEDKLVIDYNQKINARGFYLCNDAKCIKSLKKRIEKNKFKIKLDINKLELVKLLDELLEGMEK